ncbi:MAG: Ig domain-containing protein, partial [Isosphaeraceae bacterium]
MLHVSYESSNEHGLSVKSDIDSPSDESRKRRRVLLGVELLESRITLSRMTLLPSILPSFAVGQNCQVAFRATNVDGRYSYTLASGKLPKGLVLSKGGALNGEPEVGGMYHFSVKATGSSRGRPSISRSFSLTVNPATA